MLGPSPSPVLGPVSARTSPAQGLSSSNPTSHSQLQRSQEGQTRLISSRDPVRMGQRKLPLGWVQSVHEGGRSVPARSSSSPCGLTIAETARAATPRLNLQVHSQSLGRLACRNVAEAPQQTSDKQLRIQAVAPSSTACFCLILCF